MQIQLLNKRGVIVLAVLAVAALGLVAIAVWAAVRNVIIVENQSGQTIARLTVTISGENISFDNLAPGDSGSASFRIRSDDQFVAEGRLADGAVITGEYGYVTGGMFGVRATFQVQPNGSIVFIQN